MVVVDPAEQPAQNPQSAADLEDLASRLAEQIPMILDLWEAGIRRLVPATEGHGSPVTRDHIPSFLLEMAEAISPVSGPDCANEKFRVSRIHGAERAGLPDYSLVQVLQEYALLRKTIVEVLEGAKPLSSQEREVVTDAVERAMQEAGQQFARVKHEELRRIADELAAADRRKNHFLALLAHELRNPLAALLNGVEVLSRLEIHEPRLERVQAMIQRQVRHQARLLDDLLDISRITCGKILLRRADVDLVRLVQETAHDHHEEMKAAGVDLLLLDLPEEPVWVNGDRTRLSQVLSNLLSNSAKFTQSGGQVAVRMLPAPARRVTVTVRDTGIGIEPELLPRIFDPFAQADHSLDHPRGGLGLGLALVKGLVELHGGEIWAASPGSERGATFTFQLPLTERPHAEVTEGVAAAPRGPVDRALRILIIEDNSDAAQSLSDLLKLLGHTVEVAGSGPEGIETARRSLPEVVLCDLGLPEINGYGVATALRWDPATAAIRLIAVSGYAQEEDRRRARQAGFDLHLSKPVEIAELQRVLAATVDLQAPPKPA